MYKIAVLADIHFGRGDSNKLNNELSIFKNYVIDNELDAVVIAGDLHDRVLKMNEPASKYVIEFINWLEDMADIKNMEIRLIKGTKTHDHNQLNNFKHLTKRGNFRIVEELTKEELLPKLNVLYIPEEYVDISYYDDALSNKYDVIFGHGTIDFAGFVDNSESPVKGAPVFNRKVLDEASTCTIFGHIHNSISEGNCTYVGSYSRGSFIETSDKGFIVLNIDPESHQYGIERIENTLAPTYLTINIDDLEDLSDEEKLTIIKEAQNTNDHVKVITKNKNSKNIEILRAATKGTDIKVEIKAKVETKKIDEKYAFVLDRSIPLDDVIKKFAKVKYGAEIESALISDVLNDNL